MQAPALLVHHPRSSTASLAFQTVLAAPSAPPSCTNPVSLAVCCLPPLTGPPFSWLKSYSLDFPSCTKYVEQEVIFFSKSLGFLPSFSSWRVFVDRLVPSSLALLPSVSCVETLEWQGRSLHRTPRSVQGPVCCAVWVPGPRLSAG